MGTLLAARRYLNKRKMEEYKGLFLIMSYYGQVDLLRALKVEELQHQQMQSNSLKMTIHSHRFLLREAGSEVFSCSICVL